MKFCAIFNQDATRAEQRRDVVLTLGQRILDDYIIDGGRQVIEYHSKVENWETDYRAKMRHHDRTLSSAAIGFIRFDCV